MLVFHTAGELASRVKSSCVAIGNFDGVHVGHCRLIESMVKYARAARLAPVVLTFYPHPVEVLRPGTKLQRLTTTSEKLALLERLGIELAIVEPFDKRLSKLTPEEFFRQYLVSGLTARSIHVGAGFTFGHGRKGNVTMLGELCLASGIELYVENPVEIENERVSSTRIREHLRNRNVEAAARLLGRPYSLSGTVIRGDQRGARLGFRTANLSLSLEKCLPGNGVYVTRAIWQKQAFPSATNIGVRPTIAEQAPPRTGHKRHVETHLIDFSATLYDERVDLEFLSALREERKFHSELELKNQIEKDVAAVRTSFTTWQNLTS